MTANPIELQTELDQFSGTQEYHRWSTQYPRFVLTDGILHLAKRAEAFWLMDIVCSWQCQKEVWDESFQVWKIKVNRDKSAVVCCEDGNGNEVARQEIEYTDFPLSEFKLYAIYDESYRTNLNTKLVILLPNEY